MWLAHRHTPQKAILLEVLRDMKMATVFHFRLNSEEVLAFIECKLNGNVLWIYAHLNVKQPSTKMNIYLYVIQWHTAMQVKKDSSNLIILCE